MPIISSTRARIRYNLFLPVMWWHTYWSWQQLKQTDGFIQAKGLLDLDRTFWTLTAWQDLKDMYLYRDNNAHRVAMPKLSAIADEISFVYWQQEDYSLPDWETTHSRMLAQGRFYPIENCSSNHAKKIVATPHIVKEYSILPENSELFQIIRALTDKER